MPAPKIGDTFFAVVKRFGGMVRLNTREDYTMFAEEGDWLIEVEVKDAKTFNLHIEDIVEEEEVTAEPAEETTEPAA